MVYLLLFIKQLGILYRDYDLESVFILYLFVFQLHCMIYLFIFLLNAVH